ncbi:MAG: hypothetical protein ACYTER_02450 [Planctomycetota bacterium]|jgi:hypothetical protein
MSHLTEEQFESILQGHTPPADHLQKCEFCTNKLAEKKALATRLRSSFTNIEASDQFAEQLKKRLSVRVQPSASPPKAHRTKIFPYWRYWAATAAALIAIPLIVMLSAPSQAMAAKEELVKIHNHNINPDHTFYSESDPQKLANYFKRNLGFNPLMPQAGQGLALRGCCVKHFRGKETGSYVVDTPDGVMSIIVVTETLDDLGMDERFEKMDYTFGKTTFADNNMVGARIGHYTYCAVGEISCEYLTNLLVQLLTDVEN